MAIKIFSKFNQNNIVSGYCSKYLSFNVFLSNLFYYEFIFMIPDIL